MPAALASAWNEPSTTPDPPEAQESFWVTHPYHPLSGQRLTLVWYRPNWGEHRVYYHDHAGHLCSMPAGWTTLAALDPFVALAAGRSLFRVTDLLALARLCTQLAGGETEPEEG